VEEEILYTDPDVDRTRARHICGAMMFSGDDALKKISVLSGGEKSRVMLGKILATPLNLLLLDEPTNHLDMESCDSLLAAIDNFPGAVAMVTHNEMFLHALAKRLVIFQQGKIIVFEGSYQDFLEKIGWEDESNDLKAVSQKPESRNTSPRYSKKEIKQQRSKFFAEKAHVLKPIEKRIKQLEDRIDWHEKRLANLNDDMIIASQDGDSEKIPALSQEIHHCRTSIDSLFDELEIVTETLDTEKAVFQEKYETLLRQISE
jgi:ATP-binding cassette subfamily F protein 3